MKTFENSKKTGSFNGVISHINNVDAKTFILKHKELFSVVTEPFLYSGLEMDVKTLSEKKCYKDEHGTYYILGFKKVWQLDEVPEVKHYNFNGAQLIAKAMPERPVNCIGCFFADITPCPTMPIFKAPLPDCLSLQVPFIYVEINKAPEQDKNCSEYNNCYLREGTGTCPKNCITRARFNTHTRSEE